MAKMRSRPVETTDMAQEAVVSDDAGGEVETVFMESNVFTSQEDSDRFTSYIVSELTSVRDDDRKTLEENCPSGAGSGWPFRNRRPGIRRGSGRPM